MGYWKSKVLPKLKKVFEKDSAKKVAAAEAIKSFDDSKEEYNKEFEEKKTELEPKVVEIYEALPAEIKTLVKEPKESGLKKYSPGVQTFLDELVKIEFPGAKPVQEVSSKFGPALIPGPVAFVFEKVSTFIPAEETPVEPPPTTTEVAAVEETSGVKEKEIVIEEEKKEEVVTTEPEKKAEPTPELAAPAGTVEPPKVETPAEPPKP